MVKLYEWDGPNLLFGQLLSTNQTTVIREFFVAFRSLFFYLVACVIWSVVRFSNYPSKARHRAENSTTQFIFGRLNHHTERDNDLLVHSTKEVL